MPDPTRQVLALLAEHAATGLDYVSIFIFLNTVPGGHYQETIGAEVLQAVLRAALTRGWIEAGPAEGPTPLSPELAIKPGGARLHLTASGREALAR
ncbi:MAG: hypothetical protein ACRD2F_00710 [Terriglobales bacterium]